MDVKIDPRQACFFQNTPCSILPRFTIIIYTSVDAFEVISHILIRSRDHPVAVNFSCNTRVKSDNTCMCHLYNMYIAICIVYIIHIYLYFVQFLLIPRSLMYTSNVLPICLYAGSLHWHTTAHMVTSSNGNIFHVTGHLCGEFTSPGDFPAQRPVTRSFDVFLDLSLNKRLSKQSWG